MSIASQASLSFEWSRGSGILSRSEANDSRGAKLFVKDEGLSGDRGLSVDEVGDVNENTDFEECISNRSSRVELHDGSKVRVVELLLE